MTRNICKPPNFHGHFYLPDISGDMNEIQVGNFQNRALKKENKTMATICGGVSEGKEMGGGYRSEATK